MPEQDDRLEVLKKYFGEQAPVDLAKEKAEARRASGLADIAGGVSEFSSARAGTRPGGGVSESLGKDAKQKMQELLMARKDRQAREGRRQQIRDKLSGQAAAEEMGLGAKGEQAKLQQSRDFVDFDEVGEPHAVVFHPHQGYMRVDGTPASERLKNVKQLNAEEARKLRKIGLDITAEENVEKQKRHKENLKTRQDLAGLGQVKMPPETARDYPALNDTQWELGRKHAQSYNKRVEKMAPAFESIGMINAALDSDNPFDQAVVRTQMPRLMGEVGNLNESEQKAWGISPSIANRAHSVLRRYFDKDINNEWQWKDINADITEADKKFLRQIVTSSHGNKTKVLNNFRDFYIEQGLPTVGKSNKKYLEELMPRFDRQEAKTKTEQSVPLPVDIAPKQDQQAPPSTEKVTVEFNGRRLRIPKSQLESAKKDGAILIKE